MPWIRTKYPTACAECCSDIPEGTKALYNPEDRKIYCETCGFDVTEDED